MIELTVEEIAQHPVETIATDATATEVAKQFTTQQIGSLVATDPADGTIAGIVTKSDLASLIAEHETVSTTTVSEFMSAPVVTVAPETEIKNAAATMNEHGIKHLPVVEDAELVEIVTTTDLARYLSRDKVTISKEDSPD